MAPILAKVLLLCPFLILDDDGWVRGVGSKVTGEGVPAQKILHLEDDLGLVFQLDLQLSDLCLKLERVLRNTVLIIDLQAFQTDLKTDEKVNKIQILVFAVYLGYKIYSQLSYS